MVVEPDLHLPPEVVGSQPKVQSSWLKREQYGVGPGAVVVGVEVGISGSSCSSFLVALSSSVSLEGALVGALVGVVLLTTETVSSSISLALSRISRVILGFETTKVPTNRETTKKPKAARERGSINPFSNLRGSILI